MQGAPATADGRPSTPTDAVTDAPVSPADAAAGDGLSPSGAGGGPALPREEVIRRLRALGQPVTLFGEEDADRQARLRKVEKTVALVDETRGGQQENVLLMLKRQEKLSKQKGGKAAGDAASKADSTAVGSSKSAGGTDGPVPAADKTAGSSGRAAGSGGDGAAAADGAGDEVLKAFQEAAARLAAQRAEEALPVEDRIIKQLQKWCKDWEDDLEARSEEVSYSCCVDDHHFM